MGICCTKTLASDNVLPHQSTKRSDKLTTVAHSHIIAVQKWKLRFFAECSETQRALQMFSKRVCNAALIPVLLSIAIHDIATHELSKSKLIFLPSVKSHARVQII